MSEQNFMKFQPNVTELVLFNKETEQTKKLAADNIGQIVTIYNTEKELFDIELREKPRGQDMEGVSYIIRNISPKDIDSVVEGLLVHGRGTITTTGVHIEFTGWKKNAFGASVVMYSMLAIFGAGSALFNAYHYFSG